MIILNHAKIWSSGSSTLSRLSRFLRYPTEVALLGNDSVTQYCCGVMDSNHLLLQILKAEFEIDHIALSECRRSSAGLEVNAEHVPDPTSSPHPAHEV